MFVLYVGLIMEMFTNCCIHLNRLFIGIKKLLLLIEMARQVRRGDDISHHWRIPVFTVTSVRVLCLQ